MDINYGYIINYGYKSWIRELELSHFVNLFFVYTYQITNNQIAPQSNFRKSRFCFLNNKIAHQNTFSNRVFFRNHKLFTLRDSADPRLWKCTIEIDCSCGLLLGCAFGWRMRRNRVLKSVILELT